MKILIACEFSGIVREAFAAQGHDAWSCDILSTEIQGQHIQGDVLPILNDGWDMMIAFPPCTFLSTSGNRHFNISRYGQRAIQRWKNRIDALEFFMYFVNAPIDKIAIENPVGFINSAYRKPDQIIHPYYFGERQLKRTCLWLKNLPHLEYRLQPNLFGQKTASEYPVPTCVDNTVRAKKRYFTDSISGYNGNAGKTRGKTFLSIANAMADQWGIE